MPAKLPIYDRRMIILMQHCIDTAVCENQKDFLTTIGFNQSNYSQVRSGKISFTVEQMITACKKYKISMNWMAGLDDKMKLVPSTKPITRLKDAVREIEAALK